MRRSEPVAHRMVDAEPEAKPSARKDRDLDDKRVKELLAPGRIGHQLLEERRARVVQVVCGGERAAGGGAHDGHALPCGAKHLEPLV